MKKLLFLLLFLCPVFASAQDVIVKKDGSTIVSKVLEITSTEVKYKKFTNQNGPTYTIPKTDLSAINYENGEKETFTSTGLTNSPFSQPQQSVSDVTLLQMAGGVQKDPLQLKMQKIKRLKISGWVVGGTLVAGGIVVACLTIPGNDILDREIGLGIGIPLIACGIATGTACLVRAHNLEKRSRISVYNAPLYQKNFTFSNGTSLATGVDVLKDNRLHSQTLGIGLRYQF